MIEGFQKYLVEHGCKRFAETYEHKKWVKVENYDSYYVSSYGPIAYHFEYNGKRILYWGLGLAGRGPYYHLPGMEHEPLIISDDWEAEMRKLIPEHSMQKEAQKHEAAKRSILK